MCAKNLNVQTIVTKYKVTELYDHDLNMFSLLSYLLDER